jgi:hypothetical protein
MPSEKTVVIEYLFQKHWNPTTKKLSKTVMSLADVRDAIQHCKTAHSISLSELNPANFMKDVVRGSGASKNWPPSVAALRYTAVQRTGTGDVFEFVPYTSHQDEPFPDTYQAKATTRRIAVQSLSMPMSSKALGRSDEAWITQTAVGLKVVETHFALASKLPIAEITHLQMSVKLRQTEIDSLYLATYGDKTTAIITCEAKQARERILEHQLVYQVQAAFNATEVDQVIAIGLRAVKGVGLYLVEFRPISRAAAPTLIGLTVANEVVYELKPPVRGI